MNVTIAPKISKSYLLVVVFLMLVLPALSAIIEYIFYSPKTFFIPLSGKWFLFWGVGVRLFTAGLKQAINPAFTAKTIFHLESSEALLIVKELGLANICLGLVAIISIFCPTWRMASAFAGGLYFGLAGLMHIIKKPIGPDEQLALVSDVFMFAVMAVYMISYHRYLNS